jgi:hypothetical protein
MRLLFAFKQRSSVRLHPLNIICGCRGTYSRPRMQTPLSRSSICRPPLNTSRAWPGLASAGYLNPRPARQPHPTFPASYLLFAPHAACPRAPKPCWRVSQTNRRRRSLALRSASRPTNRLPLHRPTLRMNEPMEEAAAVHADIIMDVARAHYTDMVLEDREAT